MAVAPQKRTFNVEEYYQMVRCGILKEDDRVELIDGEIIQMTPIGTKHSAGVIRINRLFSKYYADEAIINIQNALRIDDWNEPQPDLTLLKLDEDWYSYRVPQAEDAYLVIEVSDSSREFDRKKKLPKYAKGGIPEVWIVDVLESCIEVYRQPEQDHYLEKQIYTRDHEISVQAFPEITLCVRDILP